MTITSDLLVVPGEEPKGYFRELAVRKFGVYTAPEDEDRARWARMNTSVVNRGRATAPGFDPCDPARALELLAPVEEHMGTWRHGDLFDCIDGFIDTVEVFERPGFDGRGSMSGHQVEGSEVGVYFSAFDPYGTYSAVIHELAHVRCIALGVELEEHDGTLLTNDNEDVYISPIRKDKLRPMSACLHGWIAWLLYTQGDLGLIESDPERHEAALVGTVKWNLPKLLEGLMTFTEFATWTGYGTGYRDRLIELAEATIEESWDLVGRENQDSIFDNHHKWIVSTEVPWSPLHDVKIPDGVSLAASDYR